MDLDPDELAGIVDLFGVLTRPALVDAMREIAFRRGDAFDEEAAEATIDEAVEDFVLVQFRHAGDETLMTGPTAFPTLPKEAEDLPHILDVERRSIERSVLADPIEKRLEAAAERVTDPERAATLLDITYDAESWTDVDLSSVRERLAAVADTGNPG